MTYYSNPDLSTLDRRVIFAARVLQEARQQDEEFKEIYYSFGHQGKLLGSILHDLAAKIRTQDGVRLVPRAEVGVVDLPGKAIIPAGWADDCVGAWRGPAGQDPVSAWPANARYGDENVAMPNGDFTTPADARALAGALLAAADAAEGS